MPTVSALKGMFQNQIAPTDDSEFLRILTEADMRLLEFGRWRWTRKQDTLIIVDGFVTLPTTYASILGARVDTYPVDIMDAECEFVPGGRGEIELGRGDSRLIDQGMNEDGLRSYKVTGYIDDNDVVTALLHYAPVTLMDPDINDSMVPEDATVNTRCPSVPALKNMMIGINMEEAFNHGGARNYIADALRILDSQEQSQRGNAQRTVQSRPMGRNVRSVRGWR